MNVYPVVPCIRGEYQVCAFEYVVVNSLQKENHRHHNRCKNELILTSLLVHRKSGVRDYAPSSINEP